MVSLLKTFAKGILYVLGLPFFILALVIFGVIGIFAFLFQAIKSFIYFFTGQKFFPELAEDKELRLLKENANQPVNQAPEENIFTHYEETDEPLMQEEKVEETIPNEEPIVETVEEACFKPAFVEEETIEETSEDDLGNLLDEEVIEEEKEIEPSKEEETVLQTAEKEESEEELVEELETYVPRSSNYGEEVDEDEDTDIGVDIDYNVR